MAVSQNGWSANDRSVIETYTVGKGIRVPLRKGDAGFLLKHVADWFDANIKDIDFNYNNGATDDWGYAERPIRGGVQLSNHASGTAIDVNATNWPLGVDPANYLTGDQIRRLRDHLKVYEGVIRWGGDYSGRKDPMHFEINADAASVSRVANKLRGEGVAKAATPPVIGAIRVAYDRTGGAASLGQPLHAEIPTLDPAGRLQRFERGNIYWHPQVDRGIAHVVRGDILGRFVSAGNEGGFGWPITDELTTPDGRGKFNHFIQGSEHRSIYWFPGIGAKIVRGALRGLWEAQGWERGIGYPVGEEYVVPGGFAQDFQRGTLTWKNPQAAKL